MKKQVPATCLILALSALPLSAQLSITTGTQSTTIDFQSHVGFDGNPDTSVGDNVFKFGTGYFRVLVERESSTWSSTWNLSEWGLSADGWSWWASNLDTGMGTGIPSQLGDYNNDGDLDDVLNTINAVAIVDRLDLGIGDAGDNVISVGDTLNGAWRDYSLTLRVVNNSGATISDWSVDVDTWHASSDSNVSTISLAWSTDNSNFTEFDSYVGTNTGGVLTPAAEPLSAGFSATVANGEDLYIRLGSIRVSGNSGSRLVFDNWTVTAAGGGGPTPATPVLAIGMSGTDLLISLPSESGFSYRLEQSEDLGATDPWGAVETKPGTGGSLEFTVGAPAPGSKTFHRVVAE
ncbi:MAG: hypothetical protein ACP5I4_14755 [Oceanipulchritudo sp.]